MTKAHTTRIMFEENDNDVRAVGVTYRKNGEDKVVRVKREIIMCAGISFLFLFVIRLNRTKFHLSMTNFI